MGDGAGRMWSPQQQAALKRAAEWAKRPAEQQVFRLFGYAGTGKTTLARELAEGVRGEVLYACFTGKAAMVLRNKGCPLASTIHSLIYKPVEDEDTGITRFILNHDSPLSAAEMLVVDEVSMVDGDLARDLLSFGRPVLVLGDPAQLPPVRGEGFFIDADPDVLLTEIHRQAEDNPIIRLSMDVRNGRRLEPGEYGSSRVVRRADVGRDEMRGLVLGADQVLCGLNNTRQAYNARVRSIRGLAGENSAHHPVVGEKLVCLKNNREKGLLNGSQWETTAVDACGSMIDITAKSLDDPAAAHVETSVPAAFFNGTEKQMDWRELRHVDQFTYGYAMTVHKSQGSQWDNVVLFDESRAFRDDARRHLYTGITRAAKQITVVI